MVNSLPSEIPSVRSGFDLLGSPIGLRSHCEASMLKRVEKVQEILKRLPDIQDAQMETTILQSCLALPKVSFALRSCPPHLVKDATSVFDDSMLEALSDFSGGPFSSWSGLKASLPAALGSLGVRQASLHAPAAYISSLDQFRELVTRILGQAPATTKHMTPALLYLAKAAGREDWTSIEAVDVPLSRRQLSKAIDQAVFDELLATAPDTRSKVLTLFFHRPCLRLAECHTILCRRAPSA